MVVGVLAEVMVQVILVRDSTGRHASWSMVGGARFLSEVVGQVILVRDWTGRHASWSMNCYMKGESSGCERGEVPLRGGGPDHPGPGTLQSCASHCP